MPPESNKPAAATPAAAPAPAPAAPKPAVTKPAAASAAPDNQGGQPVVNRRGNRPGITASKALKLDQSPLEQVKGEVERARTNFERTAGVVKTPETAAPAKPAKPAKPAASAAPAPLPDLPEPDEEPAAPTPAAAPTKIKVGEREFTPDELAAEYQRLEDDVQAAKAAQAQPAPQQQQQQTPPPTPEEIAAKEAKFIEATSASLNAPLTEEELDTILAGGKDAVSTLEKLRKRDMAVAVLRARKDMTALLNPLFAQLFQSVQPLVAQQNDVVAYQLEQEFLTGYKDFVPHQARAKEVAQELARRFPDQVRQMSKEQFLAEVARQTDVILSTEHKRWFPSENGNWRKGSTTPAVAAAPVATPQPAATPATAAAPASARAARPPAANSPSGTQMGSATPWAKTVASTLRG